MKTKIRFASLALSLMFASGAALADMKIGVSMSQFDDTWLTYLRESMDTKAKSYPDGVKLQFEDARSDVVRQLSQVESFISQKVDAIVVNPVDTAATKKITEAAVKAGNEGAPREWRRFLDDGREKLRTASARRPADVRALLEGADPDLFEALKSWRAATAKRSGVPAYVIFHDTTLAALAQAKPGDRDSLLAVPGLGPVKAERYGADVLAVLAKAAS